MNKTWNKALKDSISEVFNTMFFLVPEDFEDPEGKVHALPAKGWHEGRLTVKHLPEEITFWIWAPREVAVELAANIYATDPDKVSKDDILDAFREMMNMVVGGVLSSVDKEGSWEMGLPQSRVLEGGSVGQVVMQVPERVTLEVQQGVPLIAGRTTSLMA